MPALAAVEIDSFGVAQCFPCPLAFSALDYVRKVDFVLLNPLSRGWSLRKHSRPGTSNGLKTGWLVTM